MKAPRLRVGLVLVGVWWWWGGVGEGTWQRDEDDLLVGEFLGGVVGDGDAADLCVSAGPWHVLELDCKPPCQLLLPPSSKAMVASIPPSGKFSPALSPGVPVMMSVFCGCVSWWRIGGG